MRLGSSEVFYIWKLLQVFKVITKTDNSCMSQVRKRKIMQYCLYYKIHNFNLAGNQCIAFNKYICRESEIGNTDIFSLLFWGNKKYMFAYNVFYVCACLLSQQRKNKMFIPLSFLFYKKFYQRIFMFPP